MITLNNKTSSTVGTYNGLSISGNSSCNIAGSVAPYIADGSLLSDVITGKVSVTFAGVESSTSTAAALLLQLGQLPTTDSSGSLLINTYSQPPYGSKTIISNGSIKHLYARFTGLQFNLASGANVLTHTATYPWAKLIGVEAVNCEALDTVDFQVYDTASGTYSGTPNALLNQFSYTLNLPAGYYQRMAQFDADVYQGMIIKMNYTSVSAKTIGINLLLDQVV